MDKRELERMGSRALLVGGPKPKKPEMQQIRLVHNLRLEPVPDDGVLILMIGDEVPELGMALLKQHCLKLGMELLAHADRLKNPPSEEAPEEEKTDD